MKKIFLGLICLATSMSFLGGCKVNTHKRLLRDDWNVDVKNGVNDFLSQYGVDSSNYNKNAYVVFDFDNTSSIFDVEEQLAIYQLETMSFNISPNDLEKIISSGLGDKESQRFIEIYRDWIADISAAYTKLYEKYGPFDSNGLNEDKLTILHNDDYWKEFSTKMRCMYDLVSDNESIKTAYSWILYWFYGMTEEELYNLALRSHNKYKNVNTSKVIWQSPKTISSRIGQKAYEWTSGIQVTDNIIELWSALKDNGIDVWVCSASHIDVIKAGIDAFGLHDYCKGLIGMNIKKGDDGKYIDQYDLDTGYIFTTNGTSWSKKLLNPKSCTYGYGKVEAIKNTLFQLYDNKGPLAGFMDSTGDFNFCSEFSSLKMVICFNRANRSVRDGGGLISELAIYQKNHLHYDLKTANSNNDTFYLLQGRNENNKRTFINSSSTILVNSNEEKLFHNEQNNIQLEYFISHKLSTREILNTFSLKNDDHILLDFDYGFLQNYNGYHSI